MPILSVSDLTYVYSANTPFVYAAVNSISFSVDKGEILGIIGHTGSGKSTLLQMLNGLLKPTSGTVFYNGVDIFSNPKDMKRIRSKIGLVFQYPEYQLFEDTVEKDIAYGVKNLGYDEDAVKVAVAEAASTVKLDRKLLEKSCFDISGGEKRRAAIAGIMAMKPEIIVLDEPTAGLDPIGRHTVLNAILDYRKSTGATVIMVSHSMEDMAQFCDRILVMNKGEIALNDTVEEVFNHAEFLNEIGLAVPYVTKVLLGLKAKGIDVSTNAFTVDSAADVILSALREGE